MIKPLELGAPLSLKLVYVDVDNVGLTPLSVEERSAIRKAAPYWVIRDRLMAVEDTLRYLHAHQAP